MRPLILTLEACALLAGICSAQNASDGGPSAPQLPVGQTFRQFVFPDYAEGKLKYTLFATEAKGITLNRAETSDLKIEIYDNDGKTVTTTVTSPKADLFVNEQRMRTKNMVLVDRSDMTATSQDCDFDVKTKKFVMRDNVKVVLKHFDLSSGSGTPKPATATGAASAPASSTPAAAAPVTPDVAPTPAPASTPAPADAATPTPARASDSLLTSPGSAADTNSAPLPPSNPSK